MEDADVEFLERFGFYHSFSYLRQMVPLVQRYKILPRGGGWDDQDPAFVTDMSTYNRLEYVLQNSAGSVEPAADRDFD